MASDLVLDGYGIELKPNMSLWGAESDGKGSFRIVQKSKGIFERILDRLSSAEGGPFRGIQLADKICSFIATLRGEASEDGFFKGIAKTLRPGWGMTILPYFPAVCDSFVQSVRDVQKESSLPGYFQRKCVTVLRQGMDLIGATAYVIDPFVKGFFMTVPLISKVVTLSAIGEFASTVKDLCEFGTGMQDLSQTTALRDKAIELKAGLVADTLSETVELNQWKLVGTICSLAGTALGLTASYFGCAGFSVQAMKSTLSLAGTALACWVSYYREGMVYKPVDLFNEKQVVYYQPKANVA